jgi:hypothetical protein
MSQYILLRDALEDVKAGRLPDDCLYEYVLCRTCGKPVPRIGSNSHGGHFVPKGMGGGSGVYYDERNVNCQCYNCNEWLEGNRLEYIDYMREKYGQHVIDELRLKDKLPRPHSIEAYGIFYRENLKELRKELGIKK